MVDPVQLVPATEGLGALLVLFGSAVLEYLFPPFPGDTVTLFGAFLVAARGWSFGWVLGAVTLGSLVGAWLDYELGAAARRGAHGRLGRLPLVRGAGARLAGLQARVQRHGLPLILLNRFFPGVRAFFFVAAGLAGLPRGPVLVLAFISASLWNLLVMGLGLGLGLSWPQLHQLFVTYGQVVWLLLGGLGLLGLGLWGVRRWRAGRRTRGLS
jgi:membrane-associated protein